MKGFTLIELLVVVAIMALVGVVAIANFRTFGEDKNLNNAALDIQTLLRSAQTNASTNLKCNIQNNSIWQVEFLNSTTLNLKCQEGMSPPLLKKTLQFGDNIVIQSVSGPASCPAGTPFTVNFAPISSQINFFGYDTCKSVTIIIKNNKTGTVKSLTVEKGGRVYEQ